MDNTFLQDPEGMKEIFQILFLIYFHRLSVSLLLSMLRFLLLLTQINFCFSSTFQEFFVDLGYVISAGTATEQNIGIITYIKNTLISCKKKTNWIKNLCGYKLLMLDDTAFSFPS